MAKAKKMLEQRKKEVNKKRCDIVDGSEIQRSPVEMAKYLIVLQGFVHPRVGLEISEPSTLLAGSEGALPSRIFRCSVNPSILKMRELQPGRFTLLEP